eukprot:TRINITY_DN4208_c0_g1_i1.p1 TRINITY_DN4208_c0_g1~~TRINITY_DN4208_c0_g1_i1.p1  ORF type:complete len:270 (-),score=11.23 TRINITY_DN4208_c0_g1_i1:508-1317(-)
MGTPAFPNLGEHCEVADCNLVDFLPFTCDRCSKVFCLDHRTYGSHECPKGNKDDVTVLVCPLCAKTVRLVLDEDPNITWDRHVQSGCDPSNYAEVTKKLHCPVPRCKEVLSLSNKVQCKECRREVCLKHRFGPDHNCAAFRQADRARSWFSMGSTPWGSSQRTAQAGVSQASKTWTNAMSSLKSSAEAGLARLSLTTNDMVKAVKVSANKMQGQYSSSSSGQSLSAGGEICPQCRAQFPTVGDLIHHVESFHLQGRKGASISYSLVQPC